MKTSLSIVLGTSILLVSCSTMNQSSLQTSNDDLYYSKADARRDAVYNPEVDVTNMSPANRNMYDEEPQQQNRSSEYQYEQPNANTSAPINQNPNYSGSEEYADGKTYITNNYYGDVINEDEDYYYARRIQRFHRPMVGFGYYSPAYCGFYNDPFWGGGWNMGFGYSSLWGPSWGFGWGTGWGWGAGWGGGWYDPFWSPYYSPYAWGGGWGWNSWSYRNGYWNGYWDGRNDNNWWGNGGNAWGGNRNVVMNKPRPSRGGAVGSGNRPAPTREAGNIGGSAGTGSMRSAPIERNRTDNPNQVLTPGTRETGNTNAGDRTISRPSPAGYTPPRIPSRSENVNENTTARPNNNGTVIRKKDANAEPPKVNPNFGGTRNNSNGTSRPATTPRVREERAPSMSRPSAPSNNSRPSYSAPSRGNSGGGSMSRPSGGGGGGSSSGSRPSRPR